MAIIGISGKIGSGKDTVGKIIQFIIDQYGQVTLNNKPFGEPVGVKDCVEFIQRGDTLQYPDETSWQIKKFAGKLKQIVSILTGISVENLEKQEVKNTPLDEEWTKYAYANGFWSHSDGDPSHKIMDSVECLKERYLEEVRINWQTAYKTEFTPRILLQYIGTELFRKQLLENVWINALFVDYRTNFEAKTDEEWGKDLQDNWIITDLRFQNELKAIKERNGITIRVNRIGSLSNQNPILLTSNHISETQLDNVKFDYVINNDSTIEELIEKVKVILETEKII